MGSIGKSPIKRSEGTLTVQEPVKSELKFSAKFWLKQPKVIDRLTTAEFADLAQISRQKAHLALVRAIEGFTWRGLRLDVRTLHGQRGGQSGKQYLVAVDSLPFDLHERWKTLQAPVQLPLKLDDATAVDREWWTNALDPIVRHPRGTPEYRAARREVLSRPVCYPDGRWSKIPPDTLDKKLARYHREGFAGLTKRKRSDTGAARVTVTERWDKAVPLDAAGRQRIGDKLVRFIRSLHAQGEAVSQIGLLARGFLVGETRAAGVEGSIDELNALCTVPYNRIRAERDYRKVDRFNRDRKAHEDARGRISRHRDGLAPMSIVVGDVHPIDVLYRRADGSVATPKAIAWLDLATNRLWVDVLFPEKGRNVRAGHVAASFVRMTAAWGVPRHLYLDNGSEYGWAKEFVGDLLKIADASGNGLVEVAPWSARQSNVITAKPYNAPAKPIEGIFGLLEQLHLKRIAGWIGGDRLRKKSANHGREPDPYPGSVDELREQIGLCVALYNGSPQPGSKVLKGKSPDSAFAAAVSAGWGRTAIDPVALQLAFSERVVRTLRQGKIEVKGKFYTCRELQEHQGDRVTVMLPKFDTWTALPVSTETGQHLGMAEEDTPFGMLDPAGAIESAERGKRSRAGVRKLAAGVDKIDVLGMAGRELLPAPVQAPIENVIEVDKYIRERVEAFKQRTSNDPSPAQIAQKKAEHDREWMNAIKLKIYGPGGGSLFKATT